MFVLLLWCLSLNLLFRFVVAERMERLIPCLRSWRTGLALDARARRPIAPVPAPMARAERRRAGRRDALVGMLILIVTGSHG